METLRNGQGTMVALSGWGRDQRYIEGDEITAEGKIFTLPHGDGIKGTYSILPYLCSRAHGNMTVQCHGKARRRQYIEGKKECLCVNTVTMFKSLPACLQRTTY